MAAATTSSVASFEDISSGMSEISAESDVSELVGAANGSPEQGARAPRRAGQTLEDGTPEASTATPAFTMPTLAQAGALSGRAAKLSGQMSQQMNLVSQTTGQIQQLGSMARRIAPARYVEGAAWGTESAERAPIDGIRVVAVDAEQVQESTPLQRVE